jgi:hypothetical protein
MPKKQSKSRRKATKSVGSRKSAAERSESAQRESEAPEGGTV